MILKQLKIENLRSYVHQDIVFEEGSTLLSGDIGTGKSTILQSIEFALFGVSKGVLSGENLLRFGCNEGSVELEFSIQANGFSHDIVIKRALKRGKNGVAQVAGYIILDGIKTEYSPVELRSKILEYLGYPETLLTKNKSLIFRYSVYTPQEEMKQIVLENREERLITLRQIFNIDKYKRIIENAQEYVRTLKERRKFFEGKTSSKAARENDKNIFGEKIITLKKEKEEVSRKAVSAREDCEISRKAVAEKEKMRDAVEKIKREFAITETKISQNIIRLKEYEEISVKLEKEKKKLVETFASEKEKMKGISDDEKEITHQIVEMKKRKKGIDEDISLAERNITTFKVKIDSGKDIVKKITDIDHCPLCLQKVDHSHKEDVSAKENDKIAKFMKGMEQSQKLLDDGKKAKKEIDDSILELEKKKEIVLKAKLILERYTDSISEKERNLKRYVDSTQKITEENEMLTRKKHELLEEMSAIVFDEKQFKMLKEDYEEKRQRMHAAELKLNSAMKDIESYERMLANVEKELKEILDAEKELARLSSLIHWLEEYFISLMDIMEKHIMQSLHQSFADHFSKWFDLLIEDEYLKVRVDDDFTPLVEHNGYDIDILALSGGERTSVALAYRLALNKVISELIDEIHTNDLIILDEPTEGFSTEQLDKLKEVLDCIDCRQILIVSHEQKMESYVNRVIKVRKNDNVSSVG